MVEKLFLVLRLDNANSAKHRAEALKAHVQFTLANKHRFYLGGALRNESNAEAIGSTMIVKAETLREARNFAAQDPFEAAGVYAQTDVWYFNPGIGQWLPEKLKKL